MIQFTRAEQKTVLGHRQLFCRCNAVQKHATDTVHLRISIADLISRFQGSLAHENSEKGAHPEQQKNTSVAWPYRSPHHTPSIASLTGWAVLPRSFMFAARIRSAASSSAIFSGARVLIPCSCMTSTHVGHFRKCTTRRGRVLKSVIHQRQTEPKAKRRDSHRLPCTLN